LASAPWVGAGIFALLGEAGEVAGSAVRISFVLAGIIAAFQGIPLLIGVLTTSVTLVVFITTTLVEEVPAMITLAAILALSVGAEHWWSRARGAATLLASSSDLGSPAGP
jgi:hypothetical protein